MHMAVLRPGVTRAFGKKQLIVTQCLEPAEHQGLSVTVDTALEISMSSTQHLLSILATVY